MTQSPHFKAKLSHNTPRKLNQYLFRLLPIAIGLLLAFGMSKTALASSEINYSGTNTGLYGDDITGGPYPIGFNFTYFGNTYTELYPNTNGNVSFGNIDHIWWINNTLSSTDGGNLSGLGGHDIGPWTNTIYPFWDDLITKDTFAPGEDIKNKTIYYTTIGTAPHRHFIMQWTNMYFFQQPDLPMGTFQMILDEGTNVIHFQYRDLLGGPLSLGQSATIGIKGNDDTQFNEVSFNNPSLTQGQAITFTPNGAAYDVNTGASYEMEYVLPPGVPASPDVINPADNLTNTINTPTFEWSPAEFATSYSLLVSDQPDFSTTLVNATDLTDTTYTLNSPLAYNTTYYWKVAAVNDIGSSFSVTRSFTTAAQSFALPDVPSQLSSGLLSGYRVNSAALQGAPIKFRLTDPDQSQLLRYRIQISTDAEFNNVVIDNRSGYDASGQTAIFSFGQAGGTYLAGDASTTLVNGQDYYVRLTAEDQHAQSSGWAGPAGIAFTYDVTAPEALAAPTLIGAATHPSTILAWSASNDEHLASQPYRLEYSTDPNFSTSETIDSAATSSVLTGLNANTYYARVFARDSAGNISAASPALTFVVPAPVAITILSSPITPPSQITAVTDAVQKIVLDDFSDYTSGEGKQLSLAIGQVIYFMVDGEQHSATVKEIGADYVILTIASTPQDVRIALGDSQDVSVRQNGTKDINIRLISLQDGKVVLAFAKAPVVTGPATPVDRRALINTNIWVLLLLSPLLGFALYNTRHKKV